MSIAAGAGFEVFVTIDKQSEHQQNLAALVLTVVVVDGKAKKTTKRRIAKRKMT